MRVPAQEKDIIDDAKKKKDDDDDDDEKKKKNGGKGKGNGEKGGDGKGKLKQICRDFNTPGKGCLRGPICHFLREQPAMAAAGPCRPLRHRSGPGSDYSTATSVIRFPRN